MDKITTIIPTYNGAVFIKEALQSIFNQTRPVDEIIVVDDGSTDQTESIIRSVDKHIIFLRQPHTGMPTAGRNLGIKRSTGDFITFLDQDDWWPENKIESQLQKMKLAESPDIVMGKTEIVYENEAQDQLKLKDLYSDKRLFLLSAAMFRKSAFNKIGLFDCTMKSFGTDTDWFFRAREAEMLFYMQKNTTLYWRRHSDNQLDGIPSFRDAVIEIMKMAIHRKMKDGKRNLKSIPAFRIINET